MASDQSSDDSDLSDDAFINQVSQRWGEEESELRQAIFFQFIRTDNANRQSASSFNHSDDRMSQYERMLDREEDSEISQDDFLGSHVRKSSDMSFTMHMKRRSGNLSGRIYD